MTQGGVADAREFLLKAVKEKESILILGRVERPFEIIYNLCESLSERFHVIVTIGIGFKNDAEDLERKLNQIKSITVYNLSRELPARSAKGDSEGRSQRIAKIENELGLTAYQAASNFLLYRRFSLQYYKHWDGFYNDEEQIVEQFLGSYDLFQDIFDLFNPIALFCECPDLIPHRVAAAIAYRRGIFQLSNLFALSLGKGDAFLSSGTNCQNVLMKYYYDNPDFIRTESLEKGKQLIEKFSKGLNPEEKYLKAYRSKTTQFFSQRQFPTFRALKERKMKVLSKEVSRIRNRIWLDRHFKRELPKSPYLLLMMHHQPEASSSLISPRWVDQEKIIEQLAINAPFGYRIVVKENPLTYGLRGEEYFGFMNQFPNVHLLHPTYDNADAIHRCQAILAISGSVGLEGILSRKRVGLLASVYYEFYPGIRILDYPEEIFKHLVDPNWTPEKLNAELERFAAAYVQSTFHLGTGQDGPYPEGKTGGSNYAKGIQNFINEAKRLNLRPEEFTIRI